jgi:DNA-binding CsgD family transcriptional regulator
LVGSASGFEIVRAAGVEREIDLPYAGLQQLCRPLLETIERLPAPQSQALEIAFGLSSGEAPDRYLVGLAVLSLLSEAATVRPLLCVLDDAQWLDGETTQALAFVGRRLGADAVGLVIASRSPLEALEGHPAIQLGGLGLSDARVLLDSVVVGRLDGPVRERFLAETHGNPLALLELPSALTPAEAATGILRSSSSLTDRIETSFAARLAALPEQTRRLLVLAAAEPLGDPLLLLRAAAQLGLGIEAADAAQEAGLVEIRERCSFQHPLVRSAVYNMATAQERRQAHAALADATDRELDPDRRAWHRAQATVAPDENVAAELERTAARARSRGGLAAAAAFLERAAQLTPDASARTERTLTAAEALLEAGALDAAAVLRRTLDPGRFSDLQAARAEWLDALLFLAQCAANEQPAAIPSLLRAAGQLRRLDPPAGERAHIEALTRAWNLATPEIIEAMLDALSASEPSESDAIAALILRGWSQALTYGTPAGSDLLRNAMIALRDSEAESASPLLGWGAVIALYVWDFASWEALARRCVQVARESGALLVLPLALARWAGVKATAGQFSAATAAYDEATAVAEATGATRLLPLTLNSIVLHALSLEDDEALAEFDRLERECLGISFHLFHLDHGRALVHNAAGRYEAALEAAQRSCDRDPVKVYPPALVELVEAAARHGEVERARNALELLADLAQLGGTEWGLGLEARSAALLAEHPVDAERLYLEAIEHLQQAGTRPDLARAHLLYGEWLRRETRRIDSRKQLRRAHDLFTEIGIPGFAERARVELAATGESARKRTDATRADLTAQEAQIARLALGGLTNPQIGAKLFLSPRTVEWHLRHIYPKLGISSRRDLHTVASSI